VLVDGRVRLRFVPVGQEFFTRHRSPPSVAA
jgi:hypothetical protein